MINIKTTYGVKMSQRPEHKRILEYIKGLLNYKKTSDYVLLNPGPVLTTPKVKAALVHHDMCHRDEEFSVLVSNLRKKLKKVFKADKNHEVVLITGSGTSAIEAAISSAVPHNKKILVIINGAFGERYYEVAKVHNMNIEVLDFKWANQIDIDLVQQKIASDPDIATVIMAHHETSVGLLNPITEVGAICRKYNRIFIVDAVASLGAEDLDVVRDNIDICLSSANKAIHAIAGVAFVSVSKRAWDVMDKIKPRVYYLDLKRYRDYAVNEEQTPFTPAVSSFFALDAALDELLEEGLEKRWEKYENRNNLLKEAFSRMGLSFLTNTGNESKTITIAKVPEYIDFDVLYAQMKEFGYIIYNCKSHLKDKYFQVANMGDLNLEILQDFLNTLNYTLKLFANRSKGTSSNNGGFHIIHADVMSQKEWYSYNERIF